MRTFIILAGIFAFARFASAKNLEGRMGFGASYMGFSNSTAVSLKYFHSPYLATNFLIGFNTESATYVFGAKTSRQVLLEENMNVFLGVGAFVVSDNRTPPTATGVEFDAIVGGEFFLAGLPNLGLQFEAGIGLRSLRTTSFHSVGGGFANGAIHYYF